VTKGEYSSSSAAAPSAADLRIDDEHLIHKLRSIQEIERETKATMQRFMEAMQQSNLQEDYAQLLQAKVAELKSVSLDLDRERSEKESLQASCRELVEQNKKLLKNESRLQEETVRQEAHLKDHDKAIRKLQHQIASLQAQHAKDMDARVLTIRSLEEEITQERIKGDELTRQCESASLESRELHGAMASLHGEISALNREIDDMKEKQAYILQQKKEVFTKLEERTLEVTRLTNEKKTLQEKVTDLDRKIAAATEWGQQVHYESTSKVEHLSRERDTVQGSLAKMSVKIKQQQDTHQQLNKVSFLS
jgi:chromosome segregation ATPase